MGKVRLVGGQQWWKSRQARRAGRALQAGGGNSEGPADTSRHKGRWKAAGETEVQAAGETEVQATGEGQAQDRAPDPGIGDAGGSAQEGQQRRVWESRWGGA